jgi:predicted AAA+ superfamily ATPase
MIKRIAEEKALTLLGSFPCVSIIGPRQVGKTTLARMISKRLIKESLYLDLELMSDYSKLSDAELYLLQHADKTVIIDEVQRMPGLFPVLRALIDQKREPGRFILLGSASPDLVKQTSESLAGRIAYLELTPFLFEEIADSHKIEELWFRGGYPDPFLKNVPWTDWMQNFIRTYLERDLPAQGFSADRVLAERLWIMLAHNHGNLVNYSELGRSLEISSNVIKKYLDFLEAAFLIRQVRPYTNNLKKRLVKSPKVYIRDSGILHFLLGLESYNDLYANIKMGASWEGFVAEQIAGRMVSNRKLFFYRTHDGSELDLVIEKGGRPLAGIEIKFGSDNRPSRGNTVAAENLGATQKYIITKDGEDYLQGNGFRTCSLKTFLGNYLPEL